TRMRWRGRSEQRAGGGRRDATTNFDHDAPPSWRATIAAPGPSSWRKGTDPTAICDKPHFSAASCNAATSRRAVLSCSEATSWWAEREQRDGLVAAALRWANSPRPAGGGFSPPLGRFRRQLGEGIAQALRPRLLLRRELALARE